MTVHTAQKVTHISFIPPAYASMFKGGYKSYAPQEWARDRLLKTFDKLMAERATYDDKVRVALVLC